MRRRTQILLSVLVLLFILGGNGFADPRQGRAAGGEEMVFLPNITQNFCYLKYFDDYGNPQSGWPRSSNPYFSLDYSSDTYRMDLLTYGLWAAARPGVQASDAQISVEVRQLGVSDGSYGIVFGMADDWSQFYTFEIDQTRTYKIWRYEDPNWSVLKSGKSSSINLNDELNILMVKREGDMIQAFANEKPLASVQEGSFTGLRYVGLIAAVYDSEGMQVEFDNFSIMPLWCESGTMTQTGITLPNQNLRMDFSEDINQFQGTTIITAQGRASRLKNSE